MSPKALALSAADLASLETALGVAVAPLDSFDRAPESGSHSKLAAGASCPQSSEADTVS
jgi:hypothetical protein